MDANTIISQFGEKGILFFLMALIIAYQYFENKALKAEYKAFRDNAQTKYETMVEKVTTLTISCANQLENFNKTLSTMTEMISKWRDEFLKGKGGQS